MAEFETNFSNFNIEFPILKALNNLGYKKPSPIQMKCIPYLLSGHDVLGIAQTGSGKTAAFLLPLLNNINLNLHEPQILILTPTRELAIQVAEATIDFSKYMQGMNVITLYGGQRYDIQLRALRSGSQVIVGTPGRILDHLKRNTLNFSYVKCLVLDEADEMLRMGFIEDVKTIIKKIPKDHQTALFSATMPEAIRRIASQFMRKPKEIRIQSNFTTLPDIKQSYWSVYGICKSEALMRFLETEDFNAAIIFVRTKNATLEVSKVLEYNGYNSAPLNGDMNQTLREQTLERLRDGRLDILIATDVAARGLDVERISLVINYDIPIDSESYIHRIGRTGRAGRAGRALLFVENYERRLLRNIERTMKLTIPEIKLPNAELLNKCRLEKFINKIQQQLKSNDLNEYRNLLSKIQLITEKKLDIETLAAVLLKIAQGTRTLVMSLSDRVQLQHCESLSRNRKMSRYLRRERNYNNRTIEMELYRIEVGLNDGVEIRHIVGAIANEGNINSRYIGNIKLFASYSTIELPKGIPNKVLQNFSRIRVLNKMMKIQLLKPTQSSSMTHNNISNK